MQEYLAMWKNYVNFQDRTSVKGYWMVFLFNIIIAIVLNLLTLVIPPLSFLAIIYAIASIIPGLALSVRRLHDINKSGWWVLLALIPCVGAIILIVWYCFKSVDEGNAYGTNQV